MATSVHHNQTTDNHYHSSECHGVEQPQKDTDSKPVLTLASMKIL